MNTARSDSATVPRNHASEQDFIDAFESVLHQALDRRMLIRLYLADRELRYEELRKAVGAPHKQAYRDALDRLLSLILVNRRFVPQGQRYQTLLSPTPRGTAIARITHHLSQEGCLPDDLSPRVKALVKRVFSGEVEDADPERPAEARPSER